MTRNDGVEVRKERIAKVNEAIVALLYNGKNSEPALDVVIAEIEYSTGLTQKRILEYASIGEKRGRYIIHTKNNRIRKPEGDFDGNSKTG